MKILTLDIETKPIRCWVWSLHGEQHIALNQIDEVGGVICFAAMWHGSSKVIFHSDHHDGHDAMIRRAHELMDEADVIVTYNGRSFDMKHLRWEMAQLGLSPPAAHKDVDLYLTVKQQFRSPSNKLEFIADSLGIGNKVKHAGFPLWEGCMNDDPKSWADMKRYCIQDTRLTVDLYDRLLPWIKSHPNRNLYREDGDPLQCPTCGAPDSALIKRGFAASAVARYQKFQCTVCRSYSQARHREPQQSYRKPAA